MRTPRVARWSRARNRASRDRGSSPVREKPQPGVLRDVRGVGFLEPELRGDRSHESGIACDDLLPGRSVTGTGGEQQIGRGRLVSDVGGNRHRLLLGHFTFPVVRGAAKVSGGYPRECEGDGPRIGWRHPYDTVGIALRRGRGHRGGAARSGVREREPVGVRAVRERDAVRPALPPPLPGDEPGCMARLDRLSGPDLLMLQSEEAGWPMHIGVVAVLDCTFSVDGSAVVDGGALVGRGRHAVRHRGRAAGGGSAAGPGAPLPPGAPRAAAPAGATGVGGRTRRRPRPARAASCPSRRRPAPHSSSRWWRSCGARGSARPSPWEIGPCPDSRAAGSGVLLKLHHVAADGVGGMALLGALLDREVTGEPRVSDRPPAAPPSTSALLRDQLRRLRPSGRAVSALAHPVVLLRGVRRTWAAMASSTPSGGCRRRAWIASSGRGAGCTSSAVASTWRATSLTHTVRR